MCNYTGGGGIESFAVKPRGASFEITDAHDFFKPINATDVEFGYGGKMYVSDFVNLDWGGKSLGGRIFSLFDPQHVASDSAKQTQQLIRDGFSKRPNDELIGLLSHADMRVRQRAQFELAGRGESSAEKLNAVAVDRAATTVTRLHAVWGLGQITAKRPEVLTPLLTQLEEGDEIVRGQIVKVLGDRRVIDAAPALLKLLKDDSSRVRFFAAIALGKIAAAEPLVAIGARRGDTAFPTNSSLVPIPRAPSELRRGAINLGLLELLRNNADADPYLRHAAVMSLAWIGDLEFLQSFARDRSAAVRRGVLLVQRRMADPRVEQFLDDEDWTVATEAARAINDVPIEVSQPALARKLAQLTTSTVTVKPMASEIASTPEAPPRVIDLEPLLRRAIHANWRLGGAEHVQRVVAVAMNPQQSARMREEAFAVLASWTEPTPRDRVTGFWRPLPKRDPNVARAALNDKLPELLASAQGNLVTQVVELVARHGLKADEATFAEWLTDAKRPAAARVAALRLLAARNFAALADSLKSALTSDVPQLRAAARDVIAAHDPAAGLRELNQVLTAAARTPTNPNDKLNDPINVNNVDQQRAFATLASMKHKDADALLATWADRLAKGDIPIELQVDLLEAATARREVATINQALQQRSTALNAKTAADPLAALRLTLHGGDPEAGRAVFIGHAQGQCVRCHKIRGEGGTAGPDLTDVVKRNRETAADIREHLLQSLIDPNAKITPGFGSITLVLNSGRLVAGTLKTEDAQQVTVETADGKSASVPLTEIDERTPPKSAMPPMGKVLTPRELRDVIEFLATLTP
jgi:quinoprotein glucose dehydrogenase